MKKKMKYLIKSSLSKKLKSKWFVAANVVLAVLIIGLINMDHIISLFGGDFNEPTTIYVVDQTGKMETEFKTQFKETTKSLEDFKQSKIISKKEDLSKLKKKIKNKKQVIVLFTEKNGVLQAEVMAKNKMDSFLNQSLINAINTTKVNIALAESTIDKQELANIYAPIDVKTTYLDKDQSKEAEMEALMGVILPTVIIPVFMLIIFLVQMIGAEINDEKTTRGMEIIISNVSPKAHFFSKAIAANAFILIQAALLILFGGIGLLIRFLVGGTADGTTSMIGDSIKQVFDQLVASGIADKLIYIIPLTLIIIVLSFIAYSLLAGVLASMTTSMEDFQQLQTPIIIVSLVGYYLAIMANMFDGSILIRLLSYVPFISPSLAPALLMMGQTTVIDMIISIVLNIGAIYLLVHFGFKIYKVGILNYSSENLWKKMIKAVKENQDL